MAKKIDNAVWEEYVNKFISLNGTITVKDFCIENAISKGQFYYHRKRVANTEIENNKPVFHAISLANKENNHKSNTYTSNEVKINIGNASITIPVSETTLISLIIKELVLQC